MVFFSLICLKIFVLFGGWVEGLVFENLRSLCERAYFVSDWEASLTQSSIFF
jgi:hypothetical protein